MAKASRDPDQLRRLLSLAEIYDGGSRGDAARVGGVGLQTVRDWVLRFNAGGPEGLIDPKGSGRPPKLNEVENVWQFIRDNWLSNRVFKSYEDIIDHCCYAWNQLIDQPWKIISIGTRQWAYG